MELDESQLHATAALFVLALYAHCLRSASGSAVGEEWSAAAEKACEADAAPEAISSREDSASRTQLVSAASGPIELCFRVMKGIGMHQGNPALPVF